MTPGFVGDSGVVWVQCSDVLFPVLKALPQLWDLEQAPALLQASLSLFLK